MNLFPTSNDALSPAEEEQVFKLRSALCHVELKGGLDGFAGTRSEKLALLATFDNQGLIKWNRANARHELTREGRKCLRFVSEPQREGKTYAAAWMTRSRRAAAARMIAVVAVVLICGASMVWVAGMSSSSLASSKDEYPIQAVSAPVAPAPRAEVAQPSPMQAQAPAAPAAVSVAAFPPIMAADDEPVPQAAVPTRAPRKAQAPEPPVPVAAMAKKDDGATAAPQEKPKRLSSKRQKAPKAARRDNRRDFGFGGGMRWFMKMI